MKDKPAIVSLFLIFALVLNACVSQSVSASSPTSTTSPTLDVPVSVTSVAPVTPTAPPSPSALSATMSEMEGRVEVKMAGQDAFTPADSNTSLVENAQVQTGENSRVRLDLSTGTIIRVAPSSIFTLISNTPSADGLMTRFKLLLGKMYVILNGGSVEIETPTGTAAVRGSYLSISYSSTGSVRITCLEGHCSLSSPGGGSVDITAGESAEIIGFGQPPQVGVMTDLDLQTWLTDNPEAVLVVSALDEASTTPVALLPSGYVPPVTSSGDGGNPEPTTTATTPTVVPTTLTVIPTTPPPSLMPSVGFNSSPSVSSMIGEVIIFGMSVLPSAGGPTPTGTVSMLDGANAICTALLDATGNASCSGAIFAAGTASLIADYAGDANYIPAQSNPLSFLVTQVSTSIGNFTSSLTISVVNEPVTFSATVDSTVPAGVPAPMGTVTFTDGFDQCDANPPVSPATTWSCNIPFTSVGTRSVTASYSGDANFQASSSSLVSLTVDPATVTVVISDPPDGSSVSNPAAFTATVSTTPGPALPAGDLTFTDGVDSCIATLPVLSCSITFTVTGVRTITVSYGNDPNFVLGSPPGPITVTVP